MSKGVYGPKLKDSPVVDDKVCERELVRIEEKRCDTESEDGYPEVYEVRGPER